MKIKMIICAALLLIFCAGSSYAASLPEVSSWQNGELRETKLDALSGKKGVWYERSYRTAAGMPLHAVLIEGAGAKGWEPRSTDPEKGEISGGETAENVSVAGCPALLEYRPVLGRSLTILLSADSVLTLESKNAEREELTEAGETIVKIMKQK